MALSISVKIDPPKFQSASEMRRVIKKALKIFNDYYRKRVQQRFQSQGPGWPPRKVEDYSLEVKADKVAISRLKTRFRASNRSSFRLMEKGLANKNFFKGKGATARFVHRTRMLQELLKQTSGNSSPLFESGPKETRSVARSIQKSKLKERKVSGQLLGRMVNAMQSTFSGNKLIVTNTIPWSGSQNDGDTVGHGAVLPPRPFQYFDETDVEVFVSIVENLMEIALS